MTLFRTTTYIGMCSSHSISSLCVIWSCYAPVGRPSIAPVVFFKLHLAMFFEGIRSERQIMKVAAGRLSLRWFLGYDLHEPLPDHSSLSKICDHYGVTEFSYFHQATRSYPRQAP